MLQMFVLALSLYNTWNRGVFLLCKITNLLIYSSKDADQLNRWVEQQKVLHVRVYKGDIVVFESEYPEQKLWEEEIPANEYEWMDYYPIEFADGSAQVNIWGIYDYQFYHYAMIVEVLFHFFCFYGLFLSEYAERWITFYSLVRRFKY